MGVFVHWPTLKQQKTMLKEFDAHQQEFEIWVLTAELIEVTRQALWQLAAR